MAKGKKVRNSIDPNKKVKNIIELGELDSYLYTNYNMIVDFSFAGVFVSCKQGNFNNYLQNDKEFMQKFRNMIIDIQNLSQKTPSRIFNGGEYRHCHKTKNENFAMDIIKNIFHKIGNDDVNFEQEVGGEEIYQIGLQSEIRLFGIIRGNIFRVYFIDYYHDFEFNQTKNERNKKNCRFCAMSSNLE